MTFIDTLVSEIRGTDPALILIIILLVLILLLCRIPLYVRYCFRIKIFNLLNFSCHLEWRLTSPQRCA